MSVELILQIGAVLFFLSSCYFLFQNKKDLNSPLLVSLTTLVSYVVMIEGSFLNGSTGDAQHWTRWAFYSLSCSLLVMEIGKKLSFDTLKIAKNMFLTVLVMLTGVLASMTEDVYKSVFFIISSFVYAILMYDIFTSKSSKLSKISPYLIFGWSVFPVVFLLSQEGFSIVSGFVSVSFYLLLDLFTKVVFYLQLNKETK